MPPNLSGRRVLLVGTETGLGRAIAQALADAGTTVALVATRNDAETAFAVQRLARKTAAELSQAIDATNDMAVRVMVRQVAKQLGGLDAIVYSGATECIDLVQRHAAKELAKTGGIFIGEPATAAEALAALADSLATG